MKQTMVKHITQIQREAMLRIINSPIYQERTPDKPVTLVIAELLDFDLLMEFAGSYSLLRNYAGPQQTGRKLATGLIEAFAWIGISVPIGYNQKSSRIKHLEKLFHTGTCYHETDYYTEKLCEVEQFLINCRIAFPNQSTPNSVTNRYLDFCTYLHHLQTMLTYPSYDARSKERMSMRCLIMRNL